MPPKEGFPLPVQQPEEHRYLEHAREEAKAGERFKENAKTFDKAMVRAERGVTALELKLGGSGFSDSELSHNVREATEALRGAASVYSDVYNDLPHGNDGWDLIDRVEKLKARIERVNETLGEKNLYGIEVEMEIKLRRR